MKKKFLSLMMTLILLLSNPCVVEAMEISSLTESQQRNANTIAEIVSANWDRYGVLPSVAVAQALQETSLGKAYNNGNLWGIKSGHISYPSVADGTYGYMRVINNGRYDKALYKTDYRMQIRHILNGGYCTPEGNYYNDIIWLVNKYKLHELDNKMFAERERKAKEEKERKERERKEKERKEKERKEKARKAKWNHYYKMKYDPSVPEYAVMVNKNIIKGGAVCIYDKGRFCLKGIYNVLPGSSGYIIKTSDEKLDGMTVSIDVDENAKG